MSVIKQPRLLHFVSETTTESVARRTNNCIVVGSKPAKVVCITVLTGNRLGYTVR